MFCHHCGLEIEVKEKVGRQELCPKCSSPLHCCSHCRFYDESAHHQCRETEAEWVRDKAAANFCEYFEPSDSPRRSTSSRADEARNKLDQLFKN